MRGHLFKKPEGRCVNGRKKHQSCTHCVAFRVPNMDWLERAGGNMPFSGDLWRMRSIRDLVNEGNGLPGSKREASRFDSYGVVGGRCRNAAGLSRLASRWLTLA